MNEPAVKKPIRIPKLDSDADQRHQMESLVEGFTKFLARRRGPITAMTWKRRTDRFMKTNGTTYEQIRQTLETDFNTELQLTINELHQLISP